MAMPIRVVIDARESGTSTGRYIDRLVEYLSKLHPDFETTLLTKPHRVEYFKSLAPNFEVLATPYKEYTFSEQLGYWRQIKKLKADLVHFAKTEQPILYRGRTVTTVHDLTTARFRNPAKNYLIFTVKRWVYRWVIKVVASKSKAIIAPSNFVREDLCHYTKVDSNKVHVIYEATDKIPDKPEPFKELEGQQFIMYVGRPQPHKNLERLIQAFARLKHQYPALKLVLVGKKDILYERHQELIKKQGIKDVYFTGFVSEGQLRWLYENTAAYVFPSLSEGFGLPPLEAMAHGAPVVSSNSTCLPEINGDGAHYFNPLDVQDIAAKINDVLTSKKLKDKLIAGGQKQIAKYSWQGMAEQTLNIYREILNK